MSVLKGQSLRTLLTDLKNWFALKAQTVFSVNGNLPTDGDVTVKQVDLANNLASDKTQQSDGEFVIRTSGGHASIEDGEAFVLRILGNRVHNGYVAEQLDMTVIPIPRTAPAPITATLDDSVFEAYVSGAGTYTLTYDDGWSETPSLYGVTVSGTPLNDDSITIVWDGENTPEMTVYAPRTAPEAITATIDRDTFVGYVSQSSTITLTYTTEWSDDPADYGITVVGTPIAGDQIRVVYVKEDRGTIVTATPTALKSTGWNLYNHALGYAVVTKYSEQYGFRIGGTYSAISFSATQSGTQETITPVDGMFTVPSDGFVHVLGGNSTDTYIINAWSDWTEGYVGEFKPYEESTVDLSDAMENYFPYGLMRVGDVRDEINLNTLTAISRIGRMEYTAENLASAQGSGRAWEADTNYIYIVKAVEDINTIVVDGSYTVNDHGNELFYGSNIPVYVEVLYGHNLKNKLERDVLTISQQTLTSAQKAQVLSNIGGASQDAVDTLNSKIDIVELTAVTSQNDLNTRVSTALSEMGNATQKNIRFWVSSAFSFYGATTYAGTIYKWDGNRAFIRLQNGSQEIVGSYINGNWAWNELALNSNLSMLQILVSNSVSLQSATVSLKNFNGTLRNNGIGYSYNDKYLVLSGVARYRDIQRTGANPGIYITLPVAVKTFDLVGVARIPTGGINEYASFKTQNSTTLMVFISESTKNYDESTLTVEIPYVVLERA